MIHLFYLSFIAVLLWRFWLLLKAAESAYDLLLKAEDDLKREEMYVAELKQNIKTLPSFKGLYSANKHNN
jgi:hypothetical protein